MTVFPPIADYGFHSDCEAELAQDDLVLPYPVDSTDSGFSGEEGTSTIGSFWLVTALAKIDRAEVPA